ncbi:hypothetical protein COCON_G00003670 [Conger conger]|uniref:B-cell antigen receptor complex-associated protein alpha chain n=1 Tax=Conger conger TaxID=82655 RepID=A0A9Q1E158_CONCO|nr:hypothetical protein COCON_G00003670 [Conger conger]
MIIRSILLLLWCTDITHGNLDAVQLNLDQPLVQQKINEIAKLQCCFMVKFELEPIWVVTTRNGSCRSHFITKPVGLNDRVKRSKGNATTEGLTCHMLEFGKVYVSDMGLYQCLLNHTQLQCPAFTHGTYLQVYKPMRRFLNIGESTKNSILLSEAILLLLCVLVPGIPLLFKKKKLHQHGKKNKGEEENIYEGLNLEDLDSTYHQIQRSQVHSPYQDVDTLAQDIQLEKP